MLQGLLVAFNSKQFPYFIITGPSVFQCTLEKTESGPSNMPIGLGHI